MNRFKNVDFLRNLFRRKRNFSKDIDFTERILLDYYTSFIQNHPDLIIVFSRDGTVVSNNKRQLHELLGYRQRQKVPYQKLLQKTDYETLIAAFNDAKNGKTKRISFEIFTKHHESLHLIATFIPIQTPEKNIEAISVILKDITKKVILEQKNKLKQNHLEQAQEIAQIGSWEYDILTGDLKCSESCHPIVGLSSGQRMSKEIIFSRVHPEDRENLIALFKKAISKGTSFVTEFRIYHHETEELRHIKIKVETVLKSKQSVKLIGVLKDYTKQKKLMVELKEMNKDFRHIFDNLKAGFWMWDVKADELIFASKGLAKILGMPLEKLYQKDDFWEGMILPEHMKDFIAKNKLLNQGENVEQLYRMKTGDHVVKWIHEQTIPRVDETGEITHHFGRILDMTKEVEMQKKLEYLATHDSVTSLPNHNSFHRKLSALIDDETIESIALLHIDIDNFSWIVDYLGHDIGDQVLKNIANRLIHLRTEKSFITRENDDSFMFVIYNYEDRGDILNFADDVMEQIAKKVAIDDYEIHVTASLGISFYPENGETTIALFESAHTALYHAKSLGKNNYQIYSFDRDISAHKKYVLDKDMRQAIEEEAFEIHYQPQVNCKTNTIVGAETLLRWNHAEWGIVSPAEFIPIAEEKHLINKIGDWVIQSVCKQLFLWREQGITLCPISINISPLRFLQSDIVESIQETLKSYDIPAKYITLEITEGSLLQNDDHILDTLRQLKDLGVKIALDDFGTGYSSFQYLQSFDVDVLKIDQRFIQNLFSNEKSNTKEAAIVSSILHLANNLEIDVVAEGVEEYEQLEFLSQKQCDIIQGYIYSKPVPIKEFERVMQRRYLKPSRQRQRPKHEQERRKFYRFTFPYHLPVKMYITEIGERKIDIGYANVLADNLSIGGMRFLSTLRLPVVSNMRLKFAFELMDEKFYLEGTLIYKNEEKIDVFSYGVSFTISEAEKEKLAPIINQMTVLRNMNEPIPNTNFIEEDPYLYLRKNLM